MNRKNIILLWLISFLQGTVFYASASTIYRLSRGLTMGQFGFISGILSISILILEVPSGILSDRIGHKKTILISTCILAIAKTIFYLADSFSLFLIEAVLEAVSAAGMSGTFSALMYESAGENKEKAFGVSAACGSAGLLTAALCFTLFFSENLNGAASATAVTHVIAFVIAVFLDDAKTEEDTKKNESVKELFSEILHHKSILLFIAGTALFMEPIHTVVTFYNQLQYERAGIPMKWFGILYCLMTVLSLSSAMLDRMIEHTGRKKLFTILFVIGISIPLLLITTDNVIPSIILLALLALSESLFAPLYDLTANDAVSTSSRASMLSIFSLFANILYALTDFTMGLAADVSLSAAYALTAVFALTGMILVYLYFRQN